jgi:acetate---CoA ligase (ADP-forming)
MPSSSEDLRRHLFSPRSVAIVGQSDDPGKTAGRPLKFLRQTGYAGRVYPVNARRERVLGERAWPTLAALPEPPDHAYIVTPTEAAVAAVEDCARIGVKVATVLADGFAEAGSEGLAREARLRAACVASGMRVVGPSSLGVVDLRTKVMLTANAAFDEAELPVGRIFAASHSGSLIGALLSRGKARGIGFAGLVSVGNEVDLSLGEICAATLDDPGIDGYMLFLETMRHAEDLRRFALEAAARGKPIIAYKLGRSEAARELAVSHTGALAGEDDVADVFLKSCGIARVDTLDGLLEGLPLLSRVPVATSGRKRVGVVTTTAGGATMVIDPLASRGVTIEPASATTLAQLAAAGIEVKPARMIDLTIAGARYETMKATLDILLAAPEFDLVLAVVGSSARAQPEATVRPLIESAGAGKPLAAFLVPDAPEALAALSRAGMPSFRTPEACADAIAAALARRPPRPMAARSAAPAALASEASGQRGHFISARAGHSPEPGSSARAASGGRMLDELAAGTLLDRLGIACSPAVALDAGITQAPALPFSYPVAVKVLSAEIAHKSDVGGVALGIADGAALIAAIRSIRASVAERKPDARVARVLVQPMVSGLGEVLIGYRVDRDVGPVIMVAAGGLFTEAARDRSLRLAPVDLAEAREMIAEVRALAPLAGYRGRPRGDLDALAQAIVALSRLADDPGVAEAEINPLIVRPDGEGVVAADALVKLVNTA